MNAPYLRAAFDTIMPPKHPGALSFLHTRTDFDKVSRSLAQPRGYIVQGNLSFLAKSRSRTKRNEWPVVRSFCQIGAGHEYNLRSVSRAGMEGTQRWRWLLP